MNGDRSGRGRRIKRFREEVLALHRHLESWLKGEVPREGPEPTRLARALAGDFTVVHPDGSRGGRDDVVRSFAAAYGEKPAGYALEIRDVRVRLVGDGLGLATYRESHRGEPDRERTATALLCLRPGAETVEWLFLQETPLAVPGPAARADRPAA